MFPMRKQRDRSRLRFRTVGQQKSQRNRKAFLIFLAVLLLVAAASGFVVWRELSQREPETPEGIQNTTNMKRKINVLFIGVDEEYDEVVFADVVSANTSSGRFKVTGMCPKGKYKGQTYDEIYEGEDLDPDIDTTPLLAKAVGANSGMPIDRYIVLTLDESGRFMEALGYYPVLFENDVNYEDDRFTFKMIAGEHTLSGSEFFNYLRYVGIGATPESIEAQANIIADFLDSAISPTNAAKEQKVFEDLADVVESDINISDYARYQGFLNEVSQDNLKISVEVLEETK